MAKYLITFILALISQVITKKSYEYSSSRSRKSSIKSHQIERIVEHIYYKIASKTVNDAIYPGEKESQIYNEFPTFHREEIQREVVF